MSQWIGIVVERKFNSSLEGRIYVNIYVQVEKNIDRICLLQNLPDGLDGRPVGCVVGCLVGWPLGYVINVIRSNC